MNSIHTQNQLLKGQLASYEGLIQKKTSENLELQKKLQIIEDEFHRYTALYTLFSLIM